MNILKCVLFVMLCSLVTGCAFGGPSGEGYIAISADARGMRAFSDTLNGMITNGKADPNLTTAHWETRKLEEKEITRRETKPSILEGLFGNKAPQQL